MPTKNFADRFAEIIEKKWPVCEMGGLPLRGFIIRILKRSSTRSASVLIALYYILLLIPHVPDGLTMEHHNGVYGSSGLECGRCVFLVALILAYKYHGDRSLSMSTWSKISGISTHQIKQAEIAFLAAVNWQLHMRKETFHSLGNVVRQDLLRTLGGGR